MSKLYRNEYDNYSYPEPLKVETPETRERLRSLREEFKKKAERNYKNAKEREKHNCKLEY